MILSDLRRGLKPRPFKTDIRNEFFRQPAGTETHSATAQSKRLVMKVDESPDNHLFPGVRCGFCDSAVVLLLNFKKTSLKPAPFIKESSIW